MSISHPPVTTIPLVGPAIVTTTPAAATSAILLAANPNRVPNGLILNNGTKNLWVLFGVGPATTAAPSIKLLPNGGAIDIPGGYTGIITGISEAAPNGSCSVYEFSYL
jgi:hypothetical protein